MGEVVQLKKYVFADEVKHVTFKKVEQTHFYKCEICGDLPIISGVVIHTEPDEAHGWHE